MTIALRIQKDKRFQRFAFSGNAKNAVLMTTVQRVKPAKTTAVSRFALRMATAEMV
tara:strand:+ start:606 stop:773 length:168 start_codon:yes stop_codon:yes gene_type:complete